MHPVFASIKFGPFQSDYHKSATGADFREALSQYLVAELLPQVDEPFDRAVGSLRAAYDDQKYCGPHSAVRDLYTLEFEFQRSAGGDPIKIDLAFSPKEASFSPRRLGQPLYLWTTARKEARSHLQLRIKEICDRILRGEISGARCPVCNADLHVINNSGLFDVSCPGHCFNYNFHRDPQTGEFQHGHSFCTPGINV